MHPLLRRIAIPALLCCLLLIIFLIYIPGLTGQFIFDDTLNIVLNYRAQPQAWSLSELKEAWNSGVASQVGRPLSMMTFALNFLFTGLNPWYFKLTNICIHLASTVAIYVLTIQLLGISEKAGRPLRVPAKVVALAIASCWALHPLQVSTVLYVVQRMTELAALMTILALILYCKLRLRSNLSYKQAGAGMIGIGLITVIGVLFKENAALVPLFVAVIEVFLFRRQASAKEQRFLQGGFLIIFLVVPGVIAAGYLLLHPEFILAGYKDRDFTLTQRLLTEPRVLWEYISWVFSPSQDDFVFYYESYRPSTGLFSPLSTVFALAGLLVLTVALVLLRNRFPLLCFGIGFFLAGHVLESSIYALELVFEHRNYLPCYGLIFGVVATVSSTPVKLLDSRVAGTLGLIAILILAQRSLLETRKWSNTQTHYQTLLQYQPNSRRLNYDIGHLYFRLGRTLQNQDYLDEARRAFLRSSALDQRFFGPLSALLTVYGYTGESLPEVYRAEFLQRLRINQINGSGFVELHALARCYFSDQCKFEAAFIVDTYNAIAQNSVMSALARQAVLDQLANDLLGAFNRTDEALALFYLGESLSENVTLLDVKIILLELEQGRTEAALRSLQNARQKQKSDDVFKPSLDELEQQIQRRLRP